MRLEAAGAINAHVVAMFPDGQAEVGHEVEGVIPSERALARVDLRAIHVSFTPVLMLVNSRGTVLRVWSGLLSSAQEADILRALSAPGGG